MVIALKVVKEIDALSRSMMVNDLSKIAISGIIYGGDKILNRRINKVNSLLAEVFKTNSWSFVSHASIDATCLNASRLCLNIKGSTVLAKNYIDFLKK